MNSVYNRYIPQPDGSYRRNPMPDRSVRENPQKHNGQKPQVCSPPAPPQKEHSTPVCSQQNEHPTQRPESSYHPRENESILGFFKQLLPKDLDTGDLIVILLLLLMAGDCKEDRNSALLTLALYFFM